MKITVLMENMSERSDLAAEHGLSLFIKTSRHTVLMDMGQSDLTWANADALGIDVSAADTAVISHGHYDHTGGLIGFFERNPHAGIYIRESALGDYYHGERYIGVDKRIAKLPSVRQVSGEVFAIDEELTLFSGIDGRRLWPHGNTELTKKVGEKFVQDSFDHEQCLTVSEHGKKVLVSGCAHNGILNILSKFESVFHNPPDVVISGFHMMKKSDYTAEEIGDIKDTARELSRLPTLFYTGHCTGDAALSLMQEIMGGQLQPMHVGDVIEI